MKIYKGKEAIQGLAVDVIDNLTTNSSTDALSAKQGKILKDNLTALTNTVTNKLDKPYDSGWVNLTMLTGFNPMPSYGTPAIRRIGDILYLRGMFETPVTASSNAQFASISDAQIYAGMPTRYYLSAISSSSENATGSKAIPFTMRNDGTLYFHNANIGTWVSISGITIGM